jgi:hypothetical protein
VLLLFLFVVIVALVGALVFGYSLGVFERTVPSSLSTDPATPIEPKGAVTQLSGNAEQATQPDPTKATATQAVIGSSTQSIVTTPILTPTITSTPTTPATAPADVCAQVDLRFMNAISNVVLWRVSNTSGQGFILNHIEISWPIANDAIFNAFVDGNVIWSGEDLSPPTIISTWSGDHNERSITSSSRLEFIFGTAAAESGYNLTLRFENGCEVSNLK